VSRGKSTGNTWRDDLEQHPPHTQHHHSGTVCDMEAETRYDIEHHPIHTQHHRSGRMCDMEASRDER